LEILFEWTIRVVFAVRLWVANIRRSRVFSLLAIAGVIPLTASAGRNSSTPTKEDLALLAQCEVIEHRFERRDLIFPSATLEEHLATVARSLLPAAPPAGAQWRFLVLRDPLVTSFSFPDGAIYISSGLLALLENDDQLGGVLAHDVMHVVNRDAFQAQREYRKKETARSVAVLVARASPLAAGALSGLATLSVDGAGLGTYLALVNSGGPIALFATTGYGSEPERLADAGAVAGLQRAGRDPAQLARSFELLAEPRDPELVPTIYTDSAKLRERAAFVRQTAGNRTISAVAGSSYFDAVRDAIQDNVQMAIDGRRYRSAVLSAQRLTNARPDDPVALYWLGEAYRSLGPRGMELSEQERSLEGQRAAVKVIQKRTVEEENRIVEATPNGQENLRLNGQKAEELFLRAERLDPQFAKPHLGLGMLYSQQKRADNARAEYRRYLDLAPQAPDRIRIEKRLADLDAAAGGATRTQ
jgi:tetratricopeptide (TPR) repeat protein